MLAAALIVAWWAQAVPPAVEPTPQQPVAPTVVPPTPAPPPSLLSKRVAIYAGLGHRLGPEGMTFGPANGPNFGGSISRSYFVSRRGVDLDVGLDFFYDQFETGALGATVSQTSIALVQTAGWRWRRLRPFAQIGLGVAIGYAELDDASVDTHQPLVRGVAGLDVLLTSAIGISLRASYSLLITRPTLTTQATGTTASVTYSPLGDLFDADLGVVLLF